MTGAIKQLIKAVNKNTKAVAKLSLGLYSKKASPINAAESTKVPTTEVPTTAAPTAETQITPVHILWSSVKDAYREVDGSHALVFANADGPNRTYDWKVALRPDDVDKIVQNFRDFPLLDTITFGSSFMGPEGAALIAAHLQDVPNLKELNIEAGQIKNKGAIAIAARLKYNSFPKLRHIRLVRNFIEDDGAVALASAIPNLPNLTLVDLYLNFGIGERGRSAFENQGFEACWSFLRLIQLMQRQD